MNFKVKFRPVAKLNVAEAFHWFSSGEELSLTASCLLASSIFRRICHLLLIAVFVQYGSVQASNLIYPRPESASDERTDYPLRLLQLALSKANANYKLVPSAAAMPQGRALDELQNGTGQVNVVWSMTSREREANLLPIRICIYKGLIGWRIPLISGKRHGMFKEVKSLDNLREFVAGQGHDWPDTGILRANGIKVEGVPVYEALFKMLTYGRFDYFPRSVVEIWNEADIHARDGIEVDTHLVIRYPTAFYYFTNKNDVKLAETIRDGLEKAIADGSFNALFNKQHARLLERAHLDKRSVIDIANPLLPPETPLNRSELWFRPSDLKSK